jgi:hypothetical protein
VKNDRPALALRFFGSASPFPRMVFQRFDHDAHPLEAIGSRGAGAKKEASTDFFISFDFRYILISPPFLCRIP